MGRVGRERAGKGPGKGRETAGIPTEVTAKERVRLRCHAGYTHALHIMFPGNGSELAPTETDLHTFGPLPRWPLTTAERIATRFATLVYQNTHFQPHTRNHPGHTRNSPTFVVPPTLFKTASLLKCLLK